MSGKSTDPSAREAKVRGLAAGWKKKLPRGVKGVQVGARFVTRQEAAAQFAEVIAAADDVERLRLAHHQAVARRNELLEQTARLAGSAERLVRSLCDDDAEALVAYGLEPHKELPKRTIDEILLTTARRLRTRQLNGTMGSRQRAKLTEPKVVLLDKHGQPLPPVRMPSKVTVTEVKRAPKERKALPPKRGHATEE